MDDPSLPSIAAILVLTLLNALIALGHAALTNTRPSALRERAESGNQQAKQVLRLIEHGAILQATYQLSLVLIHISVATIAATTIAAPLLNGSSADVPPALVYALVLIPIGFVVLVLGELVPASVGSRYADVLVPWLAPFMRVLLLLLRPLVLLAAQSSRVVSALFGSQKQVNTITEEEIMTFVEGGTIEEEEKEMIYSVLQLDQMVVREVMVPRIDVTAIDIDSNIEDAQALFIESGFSRIPVYEETIDNVKGLLYAKDLLTYWHTGNREYNSNKSIRSLLRPAYFVPEQKRADDLLRELKKRKTHIAIVVDEYGGTAGLVTIEDLIEQIIGDIQDEYDLEEDEYIKLGENEYDVDAGIAIDTFNDLLEVDVPTDDSDTLGGFIYSQLGHVPTPGETVTFNNLLLRVDSVEGRRIRRVHAVLHDGGTHDDGTRDGTRDSGRDGSTNRRATQEGNAILHLEPPDAPTKEPVKDRAG